MPEAATDLAANPHRLVVLCGWLLLSLPACPPADPALGTYVGDKVTHNDFESFRGWGTDDTTALSARCPRSGRWAVRVDAAHPVGPVFKAPLGAAFAHIYAPEAVGAARPVGPAVRS